MGEVVDVERACSRVIKQTNETNDNNDADTMDAPEMGSEKGALNK